MVAKLSDCAMRHRRHGHGDQRARRRKIRGAAEPASYKHTQGIIYTSESALGDAAKSPKFKGVKEEKINFSIVLDNTGAIKDSSDVAQQLKKLVDVCYSYDGSEHQPNVVQLNWGSNGLSFTGRLTSMSTDYTLFTPDGVPLRAKVELAFADYVSSKEAELRAKKSSPDLTHLVEVKAGAALPLLCYRIYKDSAYYLEVAKSNGITNFRNIKPGTRLDFPPLR